MRSHYLRSSNPLTPWYSGNAMLHPHRLSGSLTGHCREHRPPLGQTTDDSPHILSALPSGSACDRPPMPEASQSFEPLLDLELKLLSFKMALLLALT